MKNVCLCLSVHNVTQFCRALVISSLLICYNLPKTFLALLTAQIAVPLMITHSHTSKISHVISPYLYFLIILIFYILITHSTHLLLNKLQVTQLSLHN